MCVGWMQNIAGDLIYSKSRAVKNNQGHLRLKVTQIELLFSKGRKIISMNGVWWGEGRQKLKEEAYVPRGFSLLQQ